MLFSILLFLLLLVSSALVSGSEVAYFSLTLADIEGLREDQKPSSERILHLLEKPASLLATILISNNFINVSIVIVSEVILQRLLPVAICEQWAISMPGIMAWTGWSTAAFGKGIHFALSVIGVTAILVLMGEIMPKVYARINTVQLARRMSGMFMVLSKALSPVTRIMVGWTNVLERRLARSRLTTGGPSSTDIQDAIELTVQDGKDAHKEVDILKRIVQFGDVTAKQIMRPRTDIVAIEFQAPYKELLQLVRESGYSRIPVFDEDLDNITGIIYAKDLIGHLQEADNFEWQSLVRTEILYTPEAKNIDDLLKEFQLERRHIGIVVDEYGGTAGLVTLEDIMEEIVGEIKDEFDDQVEVSYSQLDDRNYLFEGKTLINDVCRIIGSRSVPLTRYVAMRTHWPDWCSK